MIWIFTEGEGDGIESRPPFKISSTLPDTFIQPDLTYFLDEDFIWYFYLLSMIVVS